jgi:hypothetical protein
MDAEAAEPLKAWIKNRSGGSKSRWRLAIEAWPNVPSLIPFNAASTEVSRRSARQFEPG